MKECPFCGSKNIRIDPDAALDTFALWTTTIKVELDVLALTKQDSRPDNSIQAMRGQIRPMISYPKTIIWSLYQARVKNTIVSAMGHTLKSLRGKIIRLAVICFIGTIFGNEQIRQLQPTLLQQENETSGNRTFLRQTTLLSYQMQGHQNIQRHRLASSPRQQASQVAVELARIADQHHVIFRDTVMPAE